MPWITTVGLYSQVPPHSVVVPGFFAFAGSAFSFF